MRPVTPSLPLLTRIPTRSNEYEVYRSNFLKIKRPCFPFGETNPNNNFHFFYPPSDYTAMESLVFMGQWVQALSWEYIVPVVLAILGWSLEYFSVEDFPIYRIEKLDMQKNERGSQCTIFFLSMDPAAAEYLIQHTKSARLFFSDGNVKLHIARTEAALEQLQGYSKYARCGSINFETPKRPRWCYQGHMFHYFRCFPVNRELISACRTFVKAIKKIHFENEAAEIKLQGQLTTLIKETPFLQVHYYCDDEKKLSFADECFIQRFYSAIQRLWCPWMTATPSFFSNAPLSIRLESCSRELDNLLRVIDGIHRFPLPAVAPDSLAQESWGNDGNSTLWSSRQPRI